MPSNATWKGFGALMMKLAYRYQNLTNTHNLLEEFVHIVWNSMWRIESTIGCIDEPHIFWMDFITFANLHKTSKNQHPLIIFVRLRCTFIIHWCLLLYCIEASLLELKLGISPFHMIIVGELIRQTRSRQIGEVFIPLKYINKFSINSHFLGVYKSNANSANRGKKWPSDRIANWD